MMIDTNHMKQWSNSVANLHLMNVIIEYVEKIKWKNIIQF